MTNRILCNVCHRDAGGLEILTHEGCQKYSSLKFRAPLYYVFAYIAGTLTALLASGCFEEPTGPVDDISVIELSDSSSSDDGESQDSDASESSDDGDAEYMPEIQCETCSQCDTTVWPVVCYEVELCCEVEPFETSCKPNGCH